MIRIIKNRRNDIPDIDECHASVMALMEHETIKMIVIPRLNKSVFHVYQWSTSKTLPIFFKDRIVKLIDRFGVVLLEHCFLAWKKDNLLSSDEGDQSVGDSTQ